MTSYSIEINNVQKRFKNTIALQPLNIVFASGLMHGIIGPEGAGKTTLLRLIVDLLKPNQGSIVFKDNDNVHKFNAIRQHIAYMPERQSLYADLSVEEHLKFFAKLYHLNKNEYAEKQERLLSITRLDKFLDRPAGKLSGGMYKKLGLMCALLRSPKILLLDEPTNGVDPISRREFWELLFQLQQDKLLILITTAYMDEAERCNQTHLLQDGQLLAEGEPHKLLQQYKVHNFNELFIRVGQEHKEQQANSIGGQQ